MSSPATDALNRARAKAYRRLLPILFLCYVVAYVDRTNVSIAKLTMIESLPSFTNDVIGLGAGIFFLGYFLLEIPGSLIVERWSARKWIFRIMVSWGIVAALTALVKVPAHFYLCRFLLGLAEAGFFPGVIVYLTHWFPARDRGRALSMFLIATPIAQMSSPKLSNFLLQIGRNGNPEVLGLEGWQWVYIAWGIPAVVLGFVVLFFLTDRPSQARWLEPDEREALEAELAREKSSRPHMSWSQALRTPKVLLLAAAYFGVVTGNYGVEIFLPAIIKDWYDPSYSLLTWILMIPPLGSLAGQLFVGWNSDRTGERRLHTAVPIYLAAVALACTLIPGLPLWAMVLLFTTAATGLKAYLPAFWALPSLFLTEAAAAGSIGLINSVGNLGGFFGPMVLGRLEHEFGSFRPGILILAISMTISATILVAFSHARRDPAPGKAAPEPLADVVIDPV